METKAPTAPLPSNAGKDEIKVREFQGVRTLPVPLVLVNFVDGNGVEETRLAAIVSNSEVRFFNKEVFTAPAQTWLRNKILVAAGRISEAQVMKDEAKKALGTPALTDDEEQI